MVSCLEQRVRKCIGYLGSHGNHDLFAQHVLHRMCVPISYLYLMVRLLDLVDDPHKARGTGRTEIVAMCTIRRSAIDGRSLPLARDSTTWRFMVVTSGVISRVTVVITDIRRLITPLITIITTHEPPSRDPVQLDGLA